MRSIRMGQCLLLSAAVLSWSSRAAAQLPQHRVEAVPVRGIVDGEDLVRTAKQYLGVPYRWGGTTPRGFDCSGFVQYVFAQYGIALPRTAHEQVAYGDAPPPGDLRPGDLLFFFGDRGAQHVAIYVGGDTIIHASSGGHRVKLDRFSGSRTSPTWFGRRLIAIRRLLPAEGVFMLPTTPATASRHHADDIQSESDTGGRGPGGADRRDSGYRSSQLHVRP